MKTIAGTEHCKRKQVHAHYHPWKDNGSTRTHACYSNLYPKKVGYATDENQQEAQKKGYGIYKGGKKRFKLILWNQTNRTITTG